MSIEAKVNATLGETVEPADEFGQIPEQEAPTGPQPFRLDFGFLRTPTGPGSIEERIEHPLNPWQSMGVAQIIRGVEGFTDDLKLAILDILFGAVQLAKEKKTA